MRFRLASIVLVLLLAVSIPLSGVLGKTSDVTPLQGSSTGDCMAFVSDVTIPDETLLTSGEQQTKTWRIQNCGQNDWKGDVLELTVGSGITAWNQANSTRDTIFAHLPSVKPGDTFDLSIDFTVPKPGDYIIYFELVWGDGLRFGDPLWIQFTAQ